MLARPSLKIRMNGVIYGADGNADVAAMEKAMATGWAHEGAVLEQIDATVSDAVARARRDLLAGPSVSHCQDCGAEIPEGRRQALPGARHCVPCQEARDRQVTEFSGYNRRGSKDSQLR